MLCDDIGTASAAGNGRSIACIACSAAMTFTARSNTAVALVRVRGTSPGLMDGSVTLREVSVKAEVSVTA